MRRSELLALRWSDIDLMEMTIQVSRSMQYLNKVNDHISYREPKSKKSRRLISLSPVTVAVLRDHLEKRKKDLK
jgi:integrase